MYRVVLKCFVLIDLKLGDLTHQDLGQMQMYVNYYTRELMNEDDNPPIGIVLCADKSEAVVRYTLPEENTTEQSDADLHLEGRSGANARLTAFQKARREEIFFAPDLIESLFIHRNHYRYLRNGMLRHRRFTEQVSSSY